VVQRVLIVACCVCVGACCAREQDKTLEGAVSQMVKVLKISVYQLVDEGFTKATVSSGVNVMGIVNLNVSVHLEEQMAVHFKRLEEKEKRKHKREKAAKAARKSTSTPPSSSSSSSTSSSSSSPPPPPTASTSAVITPDLNQVSVEAKRQREKKKAKRSPAAKELIESIIAGDEDALKENQATHQHDVHQHRDRQDAITSHPGTAARDEDGKSSRRSVTTRKDAHAVAVTPVTAEPRRGRGKKAVVLNDDDVHSSGSE
jgi:hypothetical protein